MALTSDFESLIRATAESKGTDIAVLKQGYLHKKSGGMRREWKRRFFVLDSQGLLYYWSGKVCPFTEPQTADLPFCTSCSAESDDARMSLYMSGDAASMQSMRAPPACR